VGENSIFFVIPVTFFVTRSHCAATSTTGTPLTRRRVGLAASWGDFEWQLLLIAERARPRFWTRI
jgi:hypothetical protein